MTRLCPSCQAELADAEQAATCPRCGVSLRPSVAATQVPGAPSVAVTLVAGTQLDARYEILRPLGKGAMASVYLVRHLGLRSEHALKVLAPELADDEGLRARFVAEGRIQAQLRHPNIVHVSEIVTHPVAGLIMDYVDGPNLAAHLAGRPPPPMDEVLELLLPVLDGVGAAHAFGVVHRDLKPENILVGRDARGRPWPRVADFGIAKVATEAGAAGKRRTQAGARLGTLLYMSPEQVGGAESVDGRSDVFALGAILYEVVTGRIAFDAKSEFETMKRIVEGTYEPPERVIAGLPLALASVIRKALAVKPEERFASCADLRVALERSVQPGAQPEPRPSRSAAVTQASAAPRAPPPRVEIRADAPDPFRPVDAAGEPSSGLRSLRRTAPLAPLPHRDLRPLASAAKGTASHLAFAMVSTLFCCPPVGLVATFFAVQATSRRDRGQLAEAASASTNALTWSWLSVGSGALTWWVVFRAVMHLLPHR